MKQKTIGINPLEEYLSSREQKETDTDTPQQKTEPAQEPGVQLHQESVTPLHASELPTGQMTFAPIPQAPVVNSSYEQSEKETPNKQRITLHISAEVIDRVKNAVYWEPGLTIAGFAEEALAKALDELETERGAAFPQRRTHRLRGGRPLI